MQWNWYPRSLFGRLVVIITLGLLLAPALGSLTFLRERRDIVFDTAALHEAWRVSDIVKVVEAAPPEQRQLLLAAIDGPDFHVATAPIPFGAADSSDRDTAASSFGAVLRNQLGGDHVVRDAVDVPAHRPFPWLPRLWSRREATPVSASSTAHASVAGIPLRYVVDVQLRDGSWLTLTSSPRLQPPPAPGSGLWLDLALRLLVVIVIALFAVRLITRPLDVLSNAAVALGKNINQAPLVERGPIEIRRAARAFNEMQARIISYVRDRTRILAAVSHDLRTPITRMRLRMELSPPSPMQAKALADLREMQDMIDDTLAYVRGVECGAAQVEVDVVGLLTSLRADAEDAGHEVAISGRCKPFLCNAGALRRCVDNLLKNAIAYGGEVSIDVLDEDDTLVIAVCDRGPGIPQAQIEQVFEPYYRLEGSRSRDRGGAGLGLSIARDIARAAGGEITLRNLVDGGLEAMIRLPRATVHVVAAATPAPAVPAPITPAAATSASNV
jgi:signal transduction histidine kinase